MKTFLLALLLSAPFVTVVAQTATLTKAERKAAAKYMKATAKDLQKTVKKLSPDQLAWSPGGDAWSVEDCLKHIAAAEGGLRGMLDGFMKAPANPEKRADIKMTDEQWIAAMSSREKKVKTMTPMEPKNTSFKSAAEAQAAFASSRESLITLVKTTDVDMRNHVGQFPLGTCDSYQLAMLIAAHSKRHTDQIKEVMANPAFPKS